MSYAHIPNLHRPEGQFVLLFKRVYALEKVHGSTAVMTYRRGQIHLTPGGGVRAPDFEALFDRGRLGVTLERMGHDSVRIHGESHGGSCQGQAARYGQHLQFVAFDVQVDDEWLGVPQADAIAGKLGIQFVHYDLVPAEVGVLNELRYAPSVQAARNGVQGDQPREGVVIRPPVVVVRPGGVRICAKFKRDEEGETLTPRDAVDPASFKALTDAEDVAREFVTPRRLEQLLGKCETAPTIRDTAAVIAGMLEDVVREGEGEFLDTEDARVAISRATQALFAKWLKARDAAR